VAPELEKERDARVAGALHTLTLLAGMPDIMLPAQRLQLLTMVCTHGAKSDRLQALTQHSSASSRVCRDAARRAASEFFRTRGRAIDELGVTRPSCSQPTSGLCASQHSSANCRPRKHITLEKH
jgi:hypothetical protein